MADAPGVLVVAPNWLGDAVMALPAIADIRQHFADATLTVAARGGVADLFQMVPGVDAVVPVSWKGQVFARAALARDAAALAATQAGTAILFPNSFASAWLVRQAGIAERWGYGTDMRRRLLTRAVARPKGSRHQGQYYQHLTSQLGIPTGPLAPRLEVPPDARESARTALRAAGWDDAQPLVTFAPGAAYGTAKQWVPAHVVDVVATLTQAGTWCALVGSRADARTTQAIRAALPPASAGMVINLAGATSLAQLAGVLALSRGCVSNDSGAMHVAAALGTPVVAPFGPTIEAETRPLTAPHGWARVLTSPVWCRPCMLRECPLDHRCMTGITPQMVLATLREIPSTVMSAEVQS